MNQHQQREKVKRHTHVHTLQQRQEADRGDSFHWTTADLPAVVRPCATVQLSWAGGVPPYALHGRWWPADSSYTDDTARSWIIANETHQTAYEWLATAPGNSTVWIDAFDSTASYSTTLIFQVNYTTPAEPDSSWCQTQYPDAAAASPGVRLDFQQQATGSVIASSTSSASATPAYNGNQPTLSTSRNLAPSRGASFGANGTMIPDAREYGNTSGTIAGLSISVGVLSLAFLILLFLHLRLKKRFNRSSRGRATIGKWSERHFDDEIVVPDSMKALKTEKPWESFTVTKPKPTSSASATRKVRTPLTFSGASIFSSQSAASSRLSSFFEHRSASRTGENVGGHRGTRQSESSGANPFEDYSDSLSTSGRSDATYDVSSSKRKSTAETILSESNSVQSGTESQFSSSAHSEQASTVGGASAVSDEYYHRKKATTISPNTGKWTGKPFLDPEMASTSFRQ